MKEYKQRYYNLFQLFGSYFHQDWKDDYDWQGKEPNFEDVIRHYKTEDSFDGIQQSKSELNDLLSLKLNENELRDVITKDFISSYTGRRRGLTIN